MLEVRCDLMKLWMSVVDGSGESDGDREGEVHTRLMEGSRGRQQDKETDGAQQRTQRHIQPVGKRQERRQRDIMCEPEYDKEFSSLNNMSFRHTTS